MQKRERILAIVVAGLLLVWGGNWLFQRALQGPYNARLARIEQLQAEIKRKRDNLRQARATTEKLQRWQAQSLPSNPLVARSLYQNWLVELVGRAGFQKPNVDSSDPLSRRDFLRLPFTVRGRGTLEQLTNFLHDFYRADHLHQIQRLTIQPVPKTNELELTFSIDALVLRDADREDQLSKARSTRLAYENLADYQAIVARNVFGDGSTTDYDPADFTVLTAVLDVNGLPEAWLTVQTTDQRMRLQVGDSFEVGQFRGTVVEIDAPDVIIASDDERWLITLGESLAQATALPPEF